MTRWLLATLLCLASVAEAANRDCRKGEVWDPSGGTCVKKAKVKKSTPLELYYQGVDKLEGDKGVPDPAGAAQLLRKACDQKEPSACTLMGHILMQGKGAPDPKHAVAADAKASLKFFQRGCDGRDPQGCLGMAEVHGRGLLGKVDQAAAIAALETACGMQNGRGCYRLADQTERGLGVPASAAKAGELYKKAFALLSATCPGSGPSCYQLGLAYLTGNGTAPSREKGFQAFQQGCEAGSGEACFELGKSYFWGTGTKQDKPRSVEFYERSCVKYDFALGCHDAGVTVLMDITPPDKVRAQKFAERACELDKRQCELLAYLIATDPDPQRDEVKASEWYQLACENGSSAGCFSLAWRVSTGTGVGKDMKRAQELYERSCDGGHEAACRRLGYAFYNGDSGALVVTVDKRKAGRFWARGCDGGDAESCHWIGYLAEKGEGMNAVNDELAVLAYRNGCKLGRGSSCEALGRLALGGKGMLEKKEAQALFEQACDAGEVDSCVNLGHRYYDGDGLDKDDLASARAFERACALGAEKQCLWIASLLQGANADKARRESAVKALDAACKSKKPNVKACLALANVWAYGTIADKDQRAAFALVKDACETRKDQDACVDLANYYMNGIGVVPNVEEGKRRYQEQCDARMAASCTWLGLQLFKEQKFEVAAQLFARSCAEKHSQGCTMIGFLHYSGQGTRWDLEAAAKEYEQGCELGDPISCSNLAEKYEVGYGKGKDLKKAFELYQKACGPTATSGCWAVGRFYEAGLGGVKADGERAEREYRRSCEADTGEACQSLAALLAKKGGKPQEIAKLNARAFELATQQSKDNPYGFYVLGRFYREGVTVMKNAGKALELFGKACDGNDPQGCLAAGAMAMEAGRGGARDKFEAAAVYYDKACAAGVDSACSESAEARRLLAGPAPSPSVSAPGQVAPRRGGCGCDVGARDGGWPAAALLLLLLTGLLKPGGRSRSR